MLEGINPSVRWGNSPASRVALPAVARQVAAPSSERDLAVAGATRAVMAAVDAGALDLLQAEAMLALVTAEDDPALFLAAQRSLGGGLSAATASLIEAAAVAAARLEGVDPDSDQQEIVARLDAEMRRVEKLTFDASRPSPGHPYYASDRWRRCVDQARAHLDEARELLDDGEPLDAAAFEVLAAGERLRAALTEPGWNVSPDESWPTGRSAG